MIADIDQLMKDSGLDALFVAGPVGHNPAMTYFTGLAHVSQAFLIKVREKEPVLFHGSMERDEAAQTGLETKNLAEYDYPKLIKDAGGDTVRATALLLGRMFEDYGIMGRVAINGKVEIGPLFASLCSLEKEHGDLELVGEPMNVSVLTRARATKSAQEVDRIRAMGKITTSVVGDVASFLTSHKVQDGVLLSREGEPLTIGDVKRRINLWLAMKGAENPEATVFAIGRDAGVPHSTGEDSSPLEVGKPIVFDIFPCEAGGGYFYDFTRTWCLGYAPDEVMQTHEQVMQVFDTIIGEMKPGEPCRDYQIRTCELFEALGHPTILSDFQSQDGYVHNLGHGVGLAVHEGPSFLHLDTNTDVLQRGSVIAVEPGLYYPERGMGVRIEDTVWVRPDGIVETLVDYPKDLVLPIPGV